MLDMIRMDFSQILEFAMKRNQRKTVLKGKSENICKQKRYIDVGGLSGHVWKVGKFLCLESVLAVIMLSCDVLCFGEKYWKQLFRK